MRLGFRGSGLGIGELGFRDSVFGIGDRVYLRFGLRVTVGFLKESSVGPAFMDLGFRV